MLTQAGLVQDKMSQIKQFVGLGLMWKSFRNINVTESTAVLPTVNLWCNRYALLPCCFFRFLLIPSAATIMVGTNDDKRQNSFMNYRKACRQWYDALFPLLPRLLLHLGNMIGNSKSPVIMDFCYLYVKFFVILILVKPWIIRGFCLDIFWENQLPKSVFQHKFYGGILLRLQYWHSNWHTIAPLPMMKDFESLDYIDKRAIPWQSACIVYLVLPMKPDDDKTAVLI